MSDTMTQTFAANRQVQPHGLVLTRRGRLLLVGMPLLGLIAAALIGLFVLAGSLWNTAQASTDSEPGLVSEQVTVSPGDTLWSVASEVESTEKVQTLIQQIAEMNNLDSTQLQPGQVLHVPVSAE